MSQKKMGLTPPMGWNSWNTFTWNINETLIKETVDAIVDGGFLDAGYEYVVIDDCWSKKERDKNGYFVADPEKFPNGIKAVADYVHEKGLKFGIYSCAGTHTCAGYPGSFEHEFQDAETFANWEVDFLKYDYCYKPSHIPGEVLYKRMGMALKNCGRDILFSACNWGRDNTYDWVRSSGAHMYRSTGDISDNWASIRDLAMSQIGKECYTGAYCHNDIDMLVVGMYGNSNDGYIGSVLGGCTDLEYRTHFSLWSIMGSPLIMGCDMRKLTDSAKEILLNKDIIAINQDEESRGAYCVRQFNNPEKVMALIKPLSNGEYAIGLFNFSDVASEMSLQFWDMGLSYTSGRGLSMYDCWEKKQLGVFTERFAARLEAHGCMVLRATITKL